MSKPFSSPEDDRKLLARCFAGDTGARETFVRQYSGLIYFTIQRVLLTKHLPYAREDIEDIHNTVFLNLFDQECKKLKQFKGLNGCSLASWINVVTVRIVLNQVRKKGHDSLTWQKKRLPLEALAELKGSDSEPLQILAEAEGARIFKRGMETLPYRDRLFLKIYMENDFSLNATADLMGITLDNAYTLKHRIIEKLRAYVASAGG